MYVQTVRWIGRILNLLSVGFLLLFFFGEADFSQPIRLLHQEILMVLAFNIIGWWREGLGACISPGPRGQRPLVDAKDGMPCSGSVGIGP
jgi:hypothetical protein